MTIQVGSGITIGSGILVGGGTAPSPYPGRLMGTASTNVSQTWTPTGSPTTNSTPTPWIGTTVGNFNSTSVNRYLTTTSPTPTFLNFGTGDFTFEFFVYVPSSYLGKNSLMLTSSTTGGPAILMGDSAPGSNLNYIQSYTAAQALGELAPYTWARDAWNFVVVQRNYNVAISMWAGACSGGVANKLSVGGPATTKAANYPNSSGVQFCGGAGSTNTTQMYYNQICVSNVARYSTSLTQITIPTKFYPVDSYTTQLMTFQGTDGGTTFNNITS